MRGSPDGRRTRLQFGCHCGTPIQGLCRVQILPTRLRVTYTQQDLAGWGIGMANELNGTRAIFVLPLPAVMLLRRC